jgi:ubiquinone/menaquinone biosynthesis C-methylase UbiE
MKNSYVHGYDPNENIRLQDQAATLAELLHSDTFYPANSKVLEAGCGVGAQTVTLAKKSPDAQIYSIDISAESVSEAKQRVESLGFNNVQFQQANIFDLPFENEYFDHIFLCFVLEHLPYPICVLNTLKQYLKPGGTITAIEGDHGSTFFYPQNKAAERAIECLVELQEKGGGNALIGRELYPLFIRAGYRNVHVSPRMVYADSSRPEMVDGFTRKTFAAMIKGIRDPAVNAGIVDEIAFDKGVAGLYRAAENDGVFCYTFFKAIAQRK